MSDASSRIEAERTPFDAPAVDVLAHVGNREAFACSSVITESSSG
jgi:hypothetical protein